RAAVLPGAARRQRHADRRHAEVELSADLTPEGGIHAAGAPDLGGRAPACAVTEDAVVRLCAGPVAGGVGGRRRRRREGPVLRDGGEAGEAARDALKGYHHDQNSTRTYRATRRIIRSKTGLRSPRILAFPVSSALSLFSAMSMTVVTLTMLRPSSFVAAAPMAVTVPRKLRSGYARALSTTCCPTVTPLISPSGTVISAVTVRGLVNTSGVVSPSNWW